MNIVTVQLTESYIKTSWHTRFKPDWDWGDDNDPHHRWEVIISTNGEEVQNSKNENLKTDAQLLLKNIISPELYGFDNRLDAYIFSSYVNQTPTYPYRFNRALVVNDALAGGYWVVVGDLPDRMWRLKPLSSGKKRLYSTSLEKKYRKFDSIEKD